MNTASDESVAGQAVYSKKVLSFYDLWVLGISNSLIWKCHTKKILHWLNQSLTANHLDVGVGTGYYLDYCIFPATEIRLGLLDLNVNSLEVTTKRVSRYAPEVYQADILQPLPERPRKFDSVSLNYLLHCLPGNLETKATLFDHLAPWLNPGATISGSTILHEGVPKSFIAKRLMHIYNQKQIFSNTFDSLGELQSQLSSRYTDVEIEIIGCVALFRAQWNYPTAN